MGKVLFIESRTGGDFTMDAVWAGLVDKFGPENVIDWPPKDKHREGVPKITGNIEKDYGAERRSLCYTPQHNLLTSYTLFEINQMLRSGDIDRIFIDERPESFAIYCETSARSLDIPVVVIAGHDRFWNESPWTVAQVYGRNLEKMFLDNWRPEYDSIPKTAKMSYATNFDHLWESDKRDEFLKNKIYDICFIGYNSHGDRKVIVDHLLSKYGTDNNCIFVETRPNMMDAFLPKHEYFKKIAQSRVCINIRGGAENGKALRFYEIPYVGSYMLSQDFYGSSTQVKPFVGGVHCDYFSSLDEMDWYIRKMLFDYFKREEIARKGHEHSMKYHTARARVDYIYENLK